MSSSPGSEPRIDDAPVLHVDLDAFFASVELIDDPSLRGRPVVVGGGSARGVVASATYEARRFGVHSGMATALARRACPDLVVVPGHFDRYEEFSRRFRALVLDLTPLVEPLGLDEAFADLRGRRRLAPGPLELARGLRQRISDELHLDSAVGVARTKLFAKLGSKRAKPRVGSRGISPGPGVLWVSPQLEAEWLETLPVDALWGVGPATAAKLGRLGLRHVRDLRGLEPHVLATLVGPAMAGQLAAYARGEDPREVVADRVAKSVGHDETFAVSRQTRAELSADLRAHAEVVATALRERGVVAHTVTVVVRYDDRTSVSRSQTLDFGIDDAGGLRQVARALLASVPLSQAVRLLGLYAGSLRPRAGAQVQLRLEVDVAGGDALSAAAANSRQHQGDRAALRDAVDEIRRRFGRTALGTAADLGVEGIEARRQRGRTAFGPDQESPEH